MNLIVITGLVLILLIGFGLWYANYASKKIPIYDEDK